MSKVKTSTSDPPVEYSITARAGEKGTVSRAMDCVKRRKLLWALILLVACGVVVVLLETIFELRLFKVNVVKQGMGDIFTDAVDEKGSPSKLKPNWPAEFTEGDPVQPESDGKAGATEGGGEVGGHVKGEHRTRKPRITDIEASAVEKKNERLVNDIAVTGEPPSIQVSSQSFWLFEVACLFVSISGYAFVKHRQRCIDRAFLAKVNRQIDGV